MMVINFMFFYAQLTGFQEGDTFRFLCTFLRCPFVLRLHPAVKLAKLYSAVAFAEAAAPVVSTGF